MQGILLIDKPKGWTSFDVVAYVRKTIAAEQKVRPAQTKVGHTGTLDPLASGLLVLLIGKRYTKLAGMFSKLDKEYFVDMKLGETTETGDKESDPKFVSNIKPTVAQLKHSLRAFEGQLMQKPPIYSAIKVNGQRAYKAARQGKDIELKPRPVKIYEIELKNYKYPTLSFRASVSSGTYIRSLVTDLGDYLKTGAYMTDLKRTKVGSFNLDASLSVKKLSYGLIADHLISAEDTLTIQ